MKREWIAAFFLLLLLLMAVGNIGVIHQWNSEISAQVELCSRFAGAGEFLVSQLHWERAFSLWQNRQSYAALVLPHAEIDSIQDGFFQLRELLLQKDLAASAAAERLLDRLAGMEAMESLNLGAIF